MKEKAKRAREESRERKGTDYKSKNDRHRKRKEKRGRYRVRKQRREEWTITFNASSPVKATMRLIPLATASSVTIAND